MRDVEAFFSPSGGREFGESLYGGTALAIGLGSDFMNKLILRPMYKTQLTELASARRGLFKDIGAPSNRAYYQKVGSPSNMIYSAQERIGPPSRKLMQERTTKAVEARKAYKPEIAAAKKRYNSLRRGWKAASWGFLLTGIFDIAEYAATPGVSKIAAEKDQASMMPTLLDSAGAYTQRQRAITAIYDSQMTSRNIIGNEARFVHK